MSLAVFFLLLNHMFFLSTRQEQLAAPQGKIYNDLWICLISFEFSFKKCVGLTFLSPTVFTDYRRTGKLNLFISGYCRSDKDTLYGITWAQTNTEERADEDCPSSDGT